MQAANPSLQLLMNLAKVNAVLSRRFDRLSAHGISFSDFMILYLLGQDISGKMRRTDLAEKIGLTQSGVTRMLVPLEKIGLIKREPSERDARVSYVALTPTGRHILEESMDTANVLSYEIIPLAKIKKSAAVTELLAELGGNIG